MNQAFDTLQAIHTLEDGGFTRSQAEAIAKIVRTGQGELATKAGLEHIRESLEHKIDTSATKLRGEMAELRGEIRLLKWMVGFVVAMQAALLAKLFLN